MLKRISINGSISHGIFGNFSTSDAHIILNYLFSDEEIEGFIYKKKPSVADFKIFPTIICSAEIFKKFEAELNRLAEKRKIIVAHETKETLVDDGSSLKRVGIEHLYVCHGQKALIKADHIDALKNPGNYLKK